MLLFIALICFCVLPRLRGDTNMTPVAVTGFNRDVIVENEAVGPPYNNYASEFNAGEGTAFYQAGLPGANYGLPVSGSFVGGVGDGTVFQFQDYTANNALVFSSDTGSSSGTLTLVTPAIYHRIAVIANSGNGNSTGLASLALNFSDGSTFVTNYYAPDWFNNNGNALYGVALQGMDRINLGNGGTDGGPGNPRFYQTTINLTAIFGSANKPLASITFGKASSSVSTGVYAVSGDTNKVTPAVLANLAATGILARAASLNGKVTSTGNDTPTVTIYYGTTDGGTNPNTWTGNVSVGLQSGAFSQLVSGLSPDTTYYFTAKAVNALGATWATPSLSFTTATITLPAVINLPATNIQATLATVQGEVTSNGDDTTAVAIYYGTADGGSSAANWQHSLNLGVQPGAFQQTLTGLSPDSNYFYTASVSNGAGTAWATSSRSFSTGATNSPVPSGVAVMTQHNDNGRDGMNLNETALNINNVNTNQFGLLYTLPVDDQIYAQPLVMTNVHVLGHGTRNIVIVATINDSIYAFDADSPTPANPCWTNSFINPPNIVAPANADESAIGACGGNYMDFSGKFGIVGTPVIDPATGTLYVVVRTKENGVNFVQRLHALDITTGLDRSNSPVTITATFPGGGAGGTGSVLTFDPLRQNQRASLLLVNGIVYIAWTSHCDNTPYHGWVMGYDATTLAQLVVYNNTRNGDQGGIWMSNQGPAADTNGNVYVSTGNGDFDALNDFGESFLKLTRNGSNMVVSSWFTPYNWSNLNGADADLGSGGVMLIPGTNLLLSGGKEGVAYLVNRDKMGGLSFGTSNTNIIQSFSVTSDEIHGGAVWWDGPGASYGYIWPASTYLQQYQFDRSSGMFALPAVAQSPTTAPNGQPGGLLALTANGTNAGSGIVWAAHQLDGDANQQVLPGILHAYDAQNVASELWNSSQNNARDAVGNFAKFVVPTVANGKVFLATFSSQLDVYGLFPLPTLNATISGGNIIVTWPANDYSGFTLQYNTSLTSANWQNVTGGVISSNGFYQVTLPSTGTATFYRLKR